MADTISGAGHQGGSSGSGCGYGADGAAPTWTCGCFAYLFPPGPSDSQSWANVLAADPSCAPSLARGDVAGAVRRFAALLEPDTAQAILDRTSGMAREDLFRSVEEEARGLVEQEAAFTHFRLMADGLAQRTRALRLLGNGVHPLAAAHAWRALSAAHGLGPVDMDAADD